MKRPENDPESGVFEILIRMHLTSVTSVYSDLLPELAETQHNS